VDNLGGPQGPDEIPVGTPGPDQILARVDACGLCFSDLKIIRQGGDHPRLYHRDLSTDPIVMGHEVALTVVEVGEKLRGDYEPGQRFVVQADVYYQGKNLAFGYMLPGGFEQFVLLGDEVLRGDGGSYLIPIQRETTGHAQAALAEPWACVVRAYKAHPRTSLAPGGVTWIVGTKTAADDVPILGDQFETPEHPKTIVTTDVAPELLDEIKRKCAAWGTEQITRDGIGADGIEAIKEQLAPDGFDDIILIGASDAEFTEKAAAAVGREGIVALVGPTDSLPIALDVGRVHYHYTWHLGTPEPNVGKAYKPARTYGWLPGGKAWFVGAAGPMGQMHVQLAVESDAPPKVVVGTDIDDQRLDHLRMRLEKTAEEKGIELVLFNPQKVEGGEDARLKQLAPDGFDDIIILAPVAKIVEASWPYLGQDGVMNVFAGLPTGTIINVDIAVAGTKGHRILGTSGSTPEDLAETLSYTETGKVNTNLSVAAVGGIEAFKDGIVATQEGSYPGKIVCYPHISMPLTGLPELEASKPAVAGKLGPTGEWTVEAERELLKEADQNG
jgi:threonine dehydrogenase-like Zn-dependent dehydrogenase